MKRLSLLAIIIAAAFVAAPSSASCFGCFGTNAECGAIGSTGAGRTQCAGGFTDCHDGTYGPCAPHCHVGGDTCTSECSRTIACGSGFEPPCVGLVGFWSCCDANNNGWCDRPGGGDCPDENLDGICDNNDEYDPQACVTDPNGELCQHSPIIVSRNGRFRFIPGPVVFDLAGYGTSAGWTWPGEGVAFLAIDRNGNGQIDSGEELFGDYTPKPTERKNTNGFIALAQYDSNSDGKIDGDDKAWGSLLLWEDRNANGVSEAAELTRVEDSDITAFGLDYIRTNRRDPNGNLLRFKATLWRGGHAAPYYDVYFSRAKP